jgi:hypothetical protein
MSLSSLEGPFFLFQFRNMIVLAAGFGDPQTRAEALGDSGGPAGDADR